MNKLKENKKLLGILPLIIALLISIGGCSTKNDDKTSKPKNEDKVENKETKKDKEDTSKTKKDEDKNVEKEESKQDTSNTTEQPVTPPSNNSNTGNTESNNSATQQPVAPSQPETPPTNEIVYEKNPFEDGHPTPPTYQDIANYDVRLIGNSGKLFSTLEEALAWARSQTADESSQWFGCQFTIRTVCPSSKTHDNDPVTVDFAKF